MKRGHVCGDDDDKGAGNYLVEAHRNEGGDSWGKRPGEVLECHSSWRYMVVVK